MVRGPGYLLGAVALLVAALASGAARADHMTGLYQGLGDYRQYSLNLVQNGRAIFGEIHDATNVPLIALNGAVRDDHHAEGQAMDLASGAMGRFTIRLSQGVAALDLVLGATSYAARFRAPGGGTAGTGGAEGGFGPQGTVDGRARDGPGEPDRARREPPADEASRVTGCWLRESGGKQHWLCFSDDGRTGLYEYFAPAGEGETGDLACAAPFEAAYDAEGTVTVTVPATGDACERDGRRSGLYRLVIACRPGPEALDCNFRSVAADGTPRGEQAARMRFAAANGAVRPGAGGGNAPAARGEADRRAPDTARGDGEGADGEAVLPDF